MAHHLTAQALDLIDYLQKHPDSTRDEIQAGIRNTSYFHSIVWFVRNKAGEEVLVCTYDRTRRAYVYRLSLSRDDGRAYVENRKVKVRNETDNLVHICDRIIAKHGSDADIRIVRTLLSSVVDILDATV